MKRKYNFEVETPPQHAIIPPMRYFMLMEGVYFNEEIALSSVSDIASMNVIRVTRVIHKVNMLSQMLLPLSVI